MAGYRSVVAYVFANEDREVSELELSTTLPEWTTCAFVDGRLVATLGAYPFTVRLNGAPASMGGVTAVGTYPEFRRQGLLRRIMDQAFGTMRDRDQAFAILWASMGAIYQRFGYGLATTQVSYRFDPRYVGFEAPEPVTGTVTLMPAGDAFPTIKRLYIEYATPRNLHLLRATAMWQIGILRPEPKEQVVRVAVYRDAAGEPRGYMVYTQKEERREEPGPGHMLEVRDFIALDMEAYRGLWEYIRRHDLAGKVVMWGCIGEDDPAPHLLMEPRMLNRRTTDGVWLRVVDVEKALARRPYSDRGELTIQVHDTMCDWNTGTYLLETDGPSAQARRVDREPDLVLPPRTLASLISGHDRATDLHRWGLLEARDERALETADRLFATAYRPHCPNGF